MSTPAERSSVILPATIPAYRLQSTRSPLISAFGGISSCGETGEPVFKLATRTTRHKFPRTICRPQGHAAVSASVQVQYQLPLPASIEMFG